MLGDNKLALQIFLWIIEIKTGNNDRLDRCAGKARFEVLAPGMFKTAVAWFQGVYFNPGVLQPC